MGSAALFFVGQLGPRCGGYCIHTQPVECDAFSDPDGSTSVFFSPSGTWAESGAVDLRFSRIVLQLRRGARTRYVVGPRVGSRRVRV